MNPLRVGFVGLSASGGWAATGHVPAIRVVDGVEIVALVASTEQSAARAASQYGVPRFFGHLDGLLGCDDVDLIVVSVKVPDHRDVVMRALEAGKNVYCEWPLARDLAEAEEMAHAAEVAGARTFIGLQARSSPVVRWLRQLVCEGYVGQVLSTNISGTGLLGGATLARRSRYQLDRRSGASVLTIPFAHAVDMVQAVLGDVAALSADLVTAPSTVAVEGEVVSREVPNQVVVSAVLRSGAVAALQYRGGTSAGDEFRWEINGTQGQLLITGSAGNPQMARLSVSGARGDDQNLRSSPG